jgi:hypothetical protein
MVKHMGEPCRVYDYTISMVVSTGGIPYVQIQHKIDEETTKYYKYENTNLKNLNNFVFHGDLQSYTDLSEPTTKIRKILFLRTVADIIHDLMDNGIKKTIAVKALTQYFINNYEPDLYNNDERIVTNIVAYLTTNYSSFLKQITEHLKSVNASNIIESSSFKNSCSTIEEKVLTYASKVAKMM